MNEIIQLKISDIFLILFITLGPIKVILPFEHVTKGLVFKFKLNVALRATLISGIILILLIFIGTNFIKKWHISEMAISFTLGLVLLMQALALIKGNPTQMEMKTNLNKSSFLEKPHFNMLAYTLIAPYIITPAGIVTVLCVRIMSIGDYNIERILIVSLLIILICNMLIMVVTPWIIKCISSTVIQIVGWVFSIFQFILAIQIIMNVLYRTKII
ncbi:MAG TPA: MarC family protein [Victivallales bacterium]|nr:MarC family protein [Victivallales bacterium]